MGKNRNTRKADVPLASILVSALLVSGCHTTTRVALPDQPPPANSVAFAELKAGDDVKVTLKTGEKVSFTLSEVRADELVGVGGRHIALGDAAEVKKQTFSGVKTTWLIVGVAGGAAFFLVVAAMAAAAASLLGGV